MQEHDLIPIAIVLVAAALVGLAAWSAQRARRRRALARKYGPE